MKALVYNKDRLPVIRLVERPMPQIKDARDAIVKVTLSSICTSDIHIVKGLVPRAANNIILGHEFVGEITEIGEGIKTLKAGDRVVANCITFCGNCFFCKKGYINNCENGGWELGCRIDGCQTEYVRVPFADTGLTPIPANVTDEEALFTGDILSSGYFGAELCEIEQGENVAVIGAGPVGLCAMSCAKLFTNGKIIAIDIDQYRLEYAKRIGLADYVINPLSESVKFSINHITDKRGVDKVIEAAGTKESFQISYEIARNHSIIAIVAMYEENLTLPLPSIYGKNLTFKTGGVDAVHCKKLLDYISKGKLKTEFLISKTFALDDIIEAYQYFERRAGNCFKIAIKN